MLLISSERGGLRVGGRREEKEGGGLKSHIHKPEDKIVNHTLLSHNMRIVVAIVAIICAACPALAFKAHIISLHARPSNASPSKLLSAPPNPFRAAMPPALPAKDEEDLTSKITTYLNTVDPNSW